MLEVKYRKDHKPLAYHIHHVDLTFNLDEKVTEITSDLHVKRTEHGTRDSPLVLDGKELDFKSIAVNGKTLDSSQYEVSPDRLTVFKVPDSCVITVKNNIHPSANTSCSGLYLSDNVFTTQCESESFRRITYYQDRPDNLATFTTSVIGNKAKYPLLLSNGNPIQKEDLQGGLHKAVFDDPIPKPSYLFALVAGKLRTLHDTFLSENGHLIDLNIHVTRDKIAKTQHAMDVLQKACAWDEKVYRLPYDLDVYHIVGVPDFNAGAMENKGLNIFNENSLLVNPETSTDDDYEWIYTVVSHEFFHNYAGNRVTVKNWFELALKEGLATQKEREFLADQIGYTLPRIDNVNGLRAGQFPEDAGPTAHPVRNDSYVNISNFYTATTYSKGAELLSMLSGLLGEKVWRKGVREYFKRYDGQAVTIDEFLNTLSEVSKKDLTQFALWYSQSGTPSLDFTDFYDETNHIYILTVKQSCTNNADKKPREAFHIPIKIGLLDSKGRDLPLQLFSEDASIGTTRILELTNHEQSFVFVNIPERPVPSLLRDFSAPVKVGKSVLNDNDLTFLMAHDSNEFNRWDASQQLHERMLLQIVDRLERNESAVLDSAYCEANKSVLLDTNIPPGLKAAILALPSFNVMLGKMKSFDPDRLAKAYGIVSEQLTQDSVKTFEHFYQDLAQSCTDEFSPENAGKRSLKNLVLSRLMSLDSIDNPSTYLNRVESQFLSTRNMTDRLGALNSMHLKGGKASAGVQALYQKSMEQFYQMWKHDPQVVDKWLALQAMYSGSNVIEHMMFMLKNPAFDIKNPNNVRSLIRTFARANPRHFHAKDGSGYAFLGEVIVNLDSINESMAADVAHTLIMNLDLDPSRLEKLQSVLKSVSEHSTSSAVQELISKALGHIGKKLIRPDPDKTLEMIRLSSSDAEEESPELRKEPYVVNFRRSTSGASLVPQLRQVEDVGEPQEDEKDCTLSM